MADPERHILDSFRSKYNEMRADLEAFTTDFDAMDFDGYTVGQIRDWCRHWWEARLGGRLLDHGERRLKGTQGRN